MKKSSFFSLFLPALVAQEIIDLNHSQVLILLLVTLILIVIFGLAVFLIVRRLIRIWGAYRELVSNGWIDEPEAHWRKGEETNLNLQTLTEQQWLFNQFLSQGYDDTDIHDLLDLPHDWWS